MKNLKQILNISLITILISCGFGASNKEQLINNYYVGWVDTEANRCIFIQDSLDSSNWNIIISGYVYSIGLDERYILAKCFNGSDTSSFKSYYILDTKGYNAKSIDKENLKTFFNKDEFDREVLKKGLDHINFDKNYSLNPY